MTAEIDLTHPTDQAIVVALCNQKGGVGKTTATVNIAYALTQMVLPIPGADGQPDTFRPVRVLLIDADPQANATEHVGITVPPGAGAPEFTLNDVLTVNPDTQMVEPGVMADAVISAGEAWDGLQLVASELGLAAREQDQYLAREYRLRRALEGTLTNWDIVLIDCPPSLGQLTINALTAADRALLITEPRANSVGGLSEMTKTLTKVQQHFNTSLRLSGVVINRHSLKRTDQAQWMETLQAHYAAHLVDAVIPEREIIATATSSSSPLSLYGYRADDVNAILVKIAKHILPTAVPAPVGV